MPEISVDQSFVSFWLQRALDECGGNKKLLADRLGVRPNEVYRYMERYRNGGFSSVCPEVLFGMYLDCGLSVDLLMRQFAGHQQANEHQIPCACLREIQKGAQSIEAQNWKGKSCNETQQAVSRLADKFLCGMRGLLCTQALQSQTPCKYGVEGCTDCPCMRFMVYLEWVMAQVGATMG